jgi:hypothetical protein
MDERLVKGKGGKVFLILDNAKTHHCKILTEWAEENKRGIEGKGGIKRYFLDPAIAYAADV